MDPVAPDTSTTPTPPPAAPSFMDAVTAALAAPAPTGEPTPATPTPAAPTPTPAPATPAAPTPAGTPPAPTPASAPDTSWVQSLPGQYESPEKVREALASLEGLRANQLTDDQRAVLRLSEDADAWREFNQLTHADYAQLSDEAVLFEQFKRERPGLDEEDARYLFEQSLDTKYPGLAQEPDDRAHKAHAAELKREAGVVRQQLTDSRTQRLDALKKGALGESPAAQQQAATQARESHLDRVKQAVSSLGADGYKLTVDVNGQPLNLAVEAKDVPALQAVMENPLASLLNEDRTALDPQKLLAMAYRELHFSAALAAAYKAGQTGKGPQLSLAELHNADGGTPIPASGAGGASFADALKAAVAPPAARPRY